MKDKDDKGKEVLKSVAKMVSDKEVVRTYLQGKISVDVLNKKGIKFAKPL